LDSSIEDALNFDGLRLLAVASSQEARISIETYLKGYEGVEYELLNQREFEQHGVTVNAEIPDVLVLEVKDATDAEVHIEAIRAEPELEFLHICLLMKSPTKNAIVNLLRAGADDILSLTPNEIELSSSLARSTVNRAVVGDDRNAASRRRTIVFIHASGGAGATTLAVNSALQLQKEAKRFGGNACLIDLDIQFGDADLQLDLPMRSNLFELVKSPDRLDSRMLENLMIKGPDGLHVLTSPDEPLPFDALEKSTVEKVISLARRHHRYVVIDMPITLTSWTDSVLKAADCIFLVTQMNVLALRSARRLIDTLQEENLGGKSIMAIANRYPSKGQGRKISIAEAEKMLRVSINTTVPSNFGLLINSLDQGVPAILQQPTSKYSRTIDELLESASAKPATQKKRSFGGGLFKRGDADV
jgi:pilus assembly protein CpaE